MGGASMVSETFFDGKVFDPGKVEEIRDGV